jgi:hypothetical protein
LIESILSLLALQIGMKWSATMTFGSAGTAI